MCDINVDSWLDSLRAEHTKSSLRWNDLVEIELVEAPKPPELCHSNRCPDSSWLHKQFNFFLFVNTFL